MISRSGSAVPFLFLIMLNGNQCVSQENGKGNSGLFLYGEVAVSPLLFMGGVGKEYRAGEFTIRPQAGIGSFYADDLFPCITIDLIAEHTGHSPFIGLSFIKPFAGKVESNKSSLRQNTLLESMYIVLGLYLYDTFGVHFRLSVKKTNVESSFYQSKSYLTAFLGLTYRMLK